MTHSNDTVNSEENKPSPEEIKAHINAEADAMQHVFDDIRHQSRLSNLVTPERWEKIDVVPDHLDAPTFTDMVFQVIDMGGVAPEEDTKNKPVDTEQPAAAETEADIDAEPNAAANTEDSDANAKNSDEKADEETDASDSAPSSDTPEEPQNVIDAIKAGAVTIPCADIAQMQGKKALYVYSTDLMTDTYARWAFLAKEDNSVATFVECVRQESKTYPRPMIYKALMNHPFDLTEDQVLDAWKATQETNLYPDIKSINASNGDVYFYSDTYLTEDYAKSLAEYYSVERWMNP